MTLTAAGWLLLAFAFALALTGALLASLLVCGAVAAIAIAAPGPERRDARERNQAHRLGGSR